MPNLTQAELLMDLERQEGPVFQRTMLQLLARGRSGVRQIAARLGGDLDARLDAALRASGRQVIEMVVRAGTLAEDSGLALLGRVEPLDLLDKARELWDRGDREEARSIVERLGWRAAGTGALHLMHARIALAGGSSDDALELYRRSAEAGVNASGVLEGASLALECGRLEEAAAILRHAPNVALDKSGAAIGEALYRACQLEDKTVLEACCRVLATRGAAVLSRGLVTAMALARKSNEDTIRDLQGQLDCLIGVLSRAASSASGLLHETAQVAGVASEADAALLQFEEQAAKLLAGLSVALPESSAASESRLSSILQEAQDGGASAEEALARVAPEDLAVSCARALEEALHNEMVLDLQEPWSRTAEALRASVETGRALRDFLSRAEGMSRTASFERAISDISFACAHLEDAGLSLVVSEGGSERYELLSGVIEDSLRVLQGLARERQVGLAGDIQRDLPRLRIVRLWISRALQNLVSLALRQERPGGVVHVSARAVGAGVEISLKADVIRVPPGLRTLDEVLSRHRWRMEIPRQAGPAMLLTILAPESSEEDTLRVEVPGYDALEAGTKQALRAAEALGGSPEGAPAAAFLYCKALEIEIAAVLSPGLERHALLPRALSLRNDPQAFSDAAKATSVVLGAAERETLKRAEELVDAVMKNRVRKELADWRSLAMALALFGLPDHVLPTAPDAQFVRALYRAEQSRGTASADRVSLEQTRSLCLAALGGLSGMRQERMGRRPPPRS